MNSENQNSQTTELTSEEKKKLNKVSQIIYSLDKTTKSQKFYLPNNPTLIQHKENLINLFNEYFESEKDLTIKVSSEAFLFMNQKVYESKLKTENFAFKLYNDGVRSITFHNSLTKDELFEFMSILNKGLDLQSKDTEEDLVTLLWEKQFDSIKYKVVENIIDASYTEEDGKSTEDRIDEIISTDKSEFYGLGEEYDDIIDMEEVPLVFDASNFGEMFKIKGVLSKEELDKIQQEIEFHEKKINILDNFMDILPFALQEEVTKFDIDKSFSIVKGILESLIFSGNLAAAAKVLSKFKKFPEQLGKGSIPVDKDVETFIDNFASKEKIDDLISSLNLSFTGGTEDIIEFVSQMAEKSIPSFLKSLPSITDMQYRRAICTGMSLIFKGDPNSLLKYFNTKDPDRVKDLLYLLSQISDDRVVDLIPHFISHSDKAIKKESLSLLKNFKRNQKSIKILLSTLDDPDIEIRTITLRVIASAEIKELAKNLISRISAQDFSQKELIEKKSYFFAISKTDGNAFIPHLSDILEGKSWFSKEKPDDLYQCACFALGIIGSEKAKELLQKGSLSKNKTIQKHCKSILRKIQMGSG